MSIKLVKMDDALCDLCGKTDITTYGLCSYGSLKNGVVHLKVCSGCLPKVDEAIDKLVLRSRDVTTDSITLSNINCYMCGFNVNVVANQSKVVCTNCNKVLNVDLCNGFNCR